MEQGAKDYLLEVWHEEGEDYLTTSNIFKIQHSQVYQIIRNTDYTMGTLTARKILTVKAHRLAEKTRKENLKRLEPHSQNYKGDRKLQPPKHHLFMPQFP